MSAPRKGTRSIKHAAIMESILAAYHTANLGFVKKFARKKVKSQASITKAS
jgi:hypothetical protein